MRKVLSFVLVLALVLSSFSMAFAGTSTEIVSLSDIEGNANQSAIEVNYDLGIVTGNPDGTFQPEKAVTRAEFAAMVTRALAIPQSALAGYASTNFKDTNGYTWAVPYLAFCNSKGIMLGDGAGNAMPGKTITVNEAVTMALRAIGYTANSSELVGVWPANYVTKAQELDMYDDVAKDATGVDKANAAQIIYNLLPQQKVAVNSDGETKKLWDAEPQPSSTDEAKRAGTATTLLSSGLGCDSTRGVMGITVSLDDALISAAKYVGQYGDIYTNDDDEIVAFIAKDSEQLVGRFVDDETFKTTADEKEYNVTTTVALYTMTNGEKTGNDVDLDKDTNFGVDAPEYTLNVELSGKTIKTIHSAVNWTVTDGAQVEDSDIAEITEDHELLGNDFIEDDNDDIDYTQFALVGVKSLKEIKKDDVVYVYADEDGIRRIEVGTETVEGIVKNFKSAKSDVATKFAIGANTYKNANEVVNGVKELADDSNITVDEVAENVKAVLDARGFIFDFDSADSTDNYAVVEKMDEGISNQVKLMLADGTEKTFVVEEDDDYKALTKGAVIGYALNKDGEISEIEQTTHAAISNVMKTTAAAVTIKLPSNKVVNFGTDKSASIASDVVVFTFDGKDFDTTTIDKVDKISDNATAIPAALLFAEDDTTEVVAMIVDDAFAKGGDKSYAVINEKNKDINADEDKVWHVLGYKDGEKLDALTDDDSSSLFKSWDAPVYKAGTGFEGVNIYEVKIGTDGVITSADIATPDAVVNAQNVTDVNGRDSVTLVNDGMKALSENVVIYQVNSDDEYKVYSGSLKKGDFAALYEVDDDEDGYDIVIFARP